MLLRKRTWDILQEEFPKVAAGATLSEAMVALYLHQKDNPSCLAVAVVDERNKPVGLVTMRGILHYINESMRSREILRSFQAATFEEVMDQSCDAFGSTPLDSILDKDLLLAHPEDPLLFLMRDFLRNNKEIALVVDGEKILGMATLQDLYKGISNDVVRECQFG